MRMKSESTILQRAMQTVEGFEKVYHKMQQQTILGGRSESTFENYLRRIALVCLEFNQLPEDISEDEINEYLTALDTILITKLNCIFSTFVLRKEGFLRKL